MLPLRPRSTSATKPIGASVAVLSVIMEGSKVIVHAEWRVPDDAGVLTDPTAVTFTTRRRSAGVLQAPTSYVFPATEVTKPSTGIYEFAKVLEEGTWYVHAQGTGTAHGAGEISFVVEHAEALTT
jgi:hypothetical protein